VAVYFRNERLAEAQANSIQQAEMAAAAVALEKRQDLVRIFFCQRITWSRHNSFIFLAVSSFVLSTQNCKKELRKTMLC